VFEDYSLENTVWLAFLESGQSVQEFVGETNIRFDVLFLVAQPADTSVQLFEVYRVASGTPLRIRLFGAFGQPLNFPPRNYIYHRRRSFEGYVMKTASLNVSGTVWTIYIQHNSTNPQVGYTDRFGPSGKFVENYRKLACLDITVCRIKYSTVLWLLELQIRRGRKV